VARRVVWSLAAAADLDDAAEYISQDSKVYAAALVHQALRAARSLSQLSDRGRIVPEFQDAARREVFVGPYRLIYRATDSTVYVVAFIHGARDHASRTRDETTD
jgi:toxin ParE1/3/4